MLFLTSHFWIFSQRKSQIDILVCFAGVGYLKINPCSAETFIIFAVGFDDYIFADIFVFPRECSCGVSKLSRNGNFRNCRFSKFCFGFYRPNPAARAVPPSRTPIIHFLNFRQIIFLVCVLFITVVIVILLTAAAELASTIKSSKDVQVLLDVVKVKLPVDHELVVVQFEPSPKRTKAVPVVLALQ